VTKLNEPTNLCVGKIIIVCIHLLNLNQLMIVVFFIFNSK